MNLAIKNEKELVEKYKGVDVQKKIDNLINYFNKKPFKEKIKEIWNHEIKDYIIFENLDFEEEREKEEEEPQEKREFIFKEDFIYTDDKGKEKVSIPKVVNYLMMKYDFKTVFGKKEESIYFYEKGIYNLRGKEIIKTETERLLQERCGTSIVNEVLEKIKRKTAINQENFDEIPINFICLQNGVLDLETKELLTFNPKHYFKHKIPIKYDKKRKPTKILEFIKQTCYPEDIPVIQEWFGFCLFRRYFIKKSIILFGEKNTGKTVLLNILTKFLGEKNIAGISLQRISSNDKFALSSLKDKCANVYDDLSASDLKDSGGFKIATGGGYITAEYKFGDSFQFLTFAKNIFATNKIPNVKDINDDAYYERWIPICFDNQIELKKQDNFLFEKITKEEDMSGLLNWALIGLDRLLKNGKFSFNKTSNEIKMIMQRQNNPLIAFVEDCLIQKDDNKISKEIMYQIYTKWCQEKHVPRLSKEQLGRNLAKYTSYMVAKVAKSGRERVWKNVDLRINGYNSDTLLNIYKEEK
jgi:P4 family phage/plasmid primase-like protien